MKSVYDCKKNCCGCTACSKACPTNAITMVADSKGFYYPQIDESKCINCKKCVKICPLNKEIAKKVNQIVYAVKNKNEEIRRTSSSGGVFNSLARQIIKQNGVVYGAVYDEELNVVHAMIDKEQDLDLLKGSKYVQSDLKNTFLNVKENLQKDLLVLFSGTPCQVYGLLNFLGKKYDNLITCDFLCHGVPSSKVFNDHKNFLEKKYKAKIDKINFRFKNEDSITNLHITFKNKTTILETSANDYYYFLFNKDYSLRESCYNCHFTNTNRVSDITIGDYWNAKKVMPDFYDNKGISLVIINTIKGQSFFNKVKSKLIIKDSNLKECLQPNLYSLKKTKGYKLFWFIYNTIGYEKSVKMMKIYNILERIKNKLRKIFKNRCKYD